MSRAAKNVKVFLLEKYYEYNADEFIIHIIDIKELTRSDVLSGLEELKENGYIVYKKTSQDYCDVCLLSNFFKDYRICTE